MEVQHGNGKLFRPPGVSVNGQGVFGLLIAFVDLWHQLTVFGLLVGLLVAGQGIGPRARPPADPIGTEAAGQLLPQVTVTALGQRQQGARRIKWCVLFFTYSSRGSQSSGPFPVTQRQWGGLIF